MCGGARRGAAGRGTGAPLWARGGLPPFSVRTDVLEVSLDLCGNFVFISPSCFSGNVKNKHTQLCHSLPLHFSSRHLELETAGRGLRKPSRTRPNSFSPGHCVPRPARAGWANPSARAGGQRALVLLLPPWTGFSQARAGQVSAPTSSTPARDLN